MDVSISFCRTDEIDEVMEFIDQHWKRGHIMATDNELVDFMHRTPTGYNYAIARDGGRLVGILGFIPTAKYDETLSETGDLSLAMWKSIGDIGTGLALQDLVCKHATAIGVPGINEKVARVYKWLGFDIFDLRHYFILNEDMVQYQIACPMGDLTHSRCGESRCRLIRVEEKDLLQFELKSYWRPFKTGKYLANRYLKHPVYKYSVWAATSLANKSVRAVFVTRTVCVNSSKCLRIVDVVGDVGACGCLSDEWKNILRGECAEYVDCVEAGLSDAEMSAIGFSVVSGGTVIPNYFEPFLRENVVVKAALLNRSNDRYVMFRGDGDQDRPNRR